MTKHSDVPDRTGANLASNQRDQLFEVLAVARRRAALEYLREADPPVDVDDLAAAVAAVEYEPDWPSLRRETWTDVDAALELEHLPMMDRWDLVEFDEEAGTVHVGERTEAAWAQLDAVE